jgi:hypothetical protein
MVKGIFIDNKYIPKLTREDLEKHHPDLMRALDRLAHYDELNKPRCPECGETKHYRIIYTDDEHTEVKFYDCMMCYTHWDKDGNNLGKH